MAEPVKACHSHVTRDLAPRNSACPYFLPHVFATFAEASAIESLTVSDLPVIPLCVLQSGMMHQALSVTLSFWTCAPTSGLLVHVVSGQYVGTDWPLNFFQWSSQLPHLQVLSLVPLIFFTFMIVSPVGSFV